MIQEEELQKEINQFPCIFLTAMTKRAPIYPISEQINIQNLHMLMGDFLQASFTFHRIDFTLNGLTPEKQLNSNFPKQPN